MSITRTAGVLWKRALPWRIVATGAVVCTAMAVVSAVMPSGAPSPPAPVLSQTTPQPPSGGNSGSASGGSTSQPPNTVLHVPSAVEPPDSKSRWERFTAVVAAASREQREGEQCARMTGSLAILEPGDHRWADGVPDRQKARQDALQCQHDTAASDARIAALVQAHDRLRGDETPAAVERLKIARNSLTRFDLSRELAPEASDAQRAGDVAVATIARSDERLDALRRSADAARSNGSAPALASLAAAASAIERFDRLRMTPADVALHEAGQQATDAIEKSDRRLSEVTSALASARATNVAAARQALIDAVAGLQPIDLERASVGQRKTIEEARSIAAGYALERLVTAARGFDPEGGDPALFEQLANLKRLIDHNGGVRQPGPEEEVALRSAGLAIARLEDSDRRIRRLVDTAAAWERNPGGAQRDAVEHAHQSLLTPFDRKRLSGESLKAYETVRNAYVIVRARKDGLTPSNKGAVPIFVSADAGAERSVRAVGALRSMLARHGYSVVDRLEDAAIHIDVAAPQVEPSSIRIGGRNYDGAVVNLALAARWTYEDKVFMRLDGSGRAVGRSVGAAADEAIEAAVTDVLGNLEERVRRNDGGAR